jgi:hypothetical protein
MWGLVGGACVEGLEGAVAMRRTGGWPWGRRRSARMPFIASVVIRLGVGVGLAAAVGQSGPMSALSALSVGVAAPLIIEKMAQQAPVALPESSSISATTETLARPVRRRMAATDSQEADAQRPEVTDAI